MMLAPVRLPPRWARLATRPVATATTPRGSSKLSLALEAPPRSDTTTRVLSQSTSLRLTPATTRTNRLVQAERARCSSTTCETDGAKPPSALTRLVLALDFRWRDLEHGIRSDAFSMHNPPGFCAIAGAANAESASAPIRVNDLLIRDLCLLCMKYSMHRAHAVKSKRRNSCQEAVDRDDRARPRQPVRPPAASQQRAKRQPASRWPASQWLARPRAAKRQRARLQAVRRQRARPRPGRPPPEHQQFASQQRAEKQQRARRRPA